MVTLTEESLVLQDGGWARGQPPSPGKKNNLLNSLNQVLPDGMKSWLRRPKLYKRVVESYKKKKYSQIWYVVIRILLDTSSCYEVELFLQLCNCWMCRAVRVLPHTKSANTACKKRSWWWTGEVWNMSSWHKCWINSLIETLCVSCWTAYILQDDTRSLQYQAR